MPWSPADAKQKTKKADTPKKQRQWSAVANKTLEKTGDDGAAIKTANGVVAKSRKSGSKPSAKRTALRAGLRGTY